MHAANGAADNIGTAEISGNAENGIRFLVVFCIEMCH